MAAESMPTVIDNVLWFTNLVYAALLLLAFGGAIWLARRVIRRHRAER